MLTRVVILSFSSLLISMSLGCAVAPVAQTCLSDIPSTKDQLVSFEKQADKEARIDHHPITRTDFTVNTCNKAVYFRSGHRLLIFINPGETTSNTSIRAFEKGAVTQDTCSKNAINILESLKTDFVMKTLNEYEHRFPLLWKDKDLGPYKMLSCQPPGNLDFLVSLGDMLHTMTLELTREDDGTSCLFAPYATAPLCFERSPSWDQVTLATVATLFGLNEHERELFETTRAHLMTENQNIFNLIKELNAYVINQKLKNILIPPYNAAGHKRFAELMTLMPVVAMFTVDYLDALNRLDNKLYLKTFGPSTKNRASLIALLRNVASTYRESSSIRDRMQFTNSYNIYDRSFQRFSKIAKKLNLMS